MMYLEQELDLIQEMVMLLTALTTIAYAIFVFRLQRRRKREIIRKEIKPSPRKKFFDTLYGGLGSGLIKTLEDIRHIHEVGPAGAYSLTELLKEFKIELISSFNSKEYEKEKLLEYSEKVSEFIKKTEQRAPFEDLPETEKNILTDVSSLLVDKNRTLIERKLNNLANIIKAKNDELIESRKTSSRATTLATIGLMLTIIFGLLAILK